MRPPLFKALLAELAHLFHCVRDSLSLFLLKAFHLLSLCFIGFVEFLGGHTQLLREKDRILQYVLATSDIVEQSPYAENLTYFHITIQNVILVLHLLVDFVLRHNAVEVGPLYHVIVVIGRFLLFPFVFGSF